VIVVIGPTHLRGTGSAGAPDGVAGRIAVAAAQGGSAVELIDKIGDDPVGDALLVALARARVGHVAVLRDAVHPTAHRAGEDDEPADVPLDPAADPVASATPWIVGPAEAPVLDAADVGLALRYLTEYRVIVAVHAPDAIVAEATAAADWAGAHLILVAAPGREITTGVPLGALVVEGEDDGEDASGLGGRLGQYAAAVDQGTTPATAYAVLTTPPD
jgi:hypothetical protein